MAIAEGAHSSNAENHIGAGTGSEEPDYVEARVAGRLVTHRPDGGFDGFSFDYPMPAGMRHNDIMEAVILEIAAGRGRASGQPFSAVFARQMIEERRAFSQAFPDKHAQAATVEALLMERPGLFRA